MKLKTLSLDLFTVRTLLEEKEVIPISHKIIESLIPDIKSTYKCDSLSVCFDGANYWLFDGYHRLEAMKRLGFNACKVKVYRGTRRDALQRYINDKLKSTESNVFKSCIRLLAEDAKWSVLDSQNLSKIFDRNIVFFENIKLFKKFAWKYVCLSRNKHGTLNLLQRFRNKKI